MTERKVNKAWCLTMKSWLTFYETKSRRGTSWSIGRQTLVRSARPMSSITTKRRAEQVSTSDLSRTISRALGSMIRAYADFWVSRDLQGSSFRDVFLFQITNVDSGLKRFKNLVELVLSCNGIAECDSANLPSCLEVSLLGVNLSSEIKILYSGGVCRFWILVETIWMIFRCSSTNRSNDWTIWACHITGLRIWATTWMPTTGESLSLKML